MNTNGTNRAAETRPVATYRITKPRSRTTRPSATGTAATVTGGRVAPMLASSSSAAPPTPSTTYDVRQPNAIDQPLGDRSDHERADPDAGNRDAEGRRPPAQEPPSDRGDHRHVGTGHRGADAHPVGEVAEPDGSDARRQQQRHAQQRRSDEQQRSRSDPIGHPARHQPEPEVPRRGDREHEGGGPLAGVELRSHRVEERAEAVHDAENHEHRQERRGDDDPSSCRIDLLGRLVDDALPDCHDAGAFQTSARALRPWSPSPSAP